MNVHRAILIPRIATERILIRPLLPKDAEGYFAIFGDPEICRFEDFEPESYEQAVLDVAEVMALYGTPGDKHEYAVTEKATDCLLGVVCFRTEENTAFIGFHFARNCQGKGFASESVAVLLNHLETVERMTIKAEVEPDNAASRKLLSRLGLVQDVPDDVARGIQRDLVYARPTKA